MSKLDAIEKRMVKMAAATLNMGDAHTAARGIADIIKFLMSRVSPDKKSKYMDKLRKHISEIRPAEISGAKSPESSTIGQSITFIKTVLRGHHPLYIIEVIKNILVYL